MSEEIEEGSVDQINHQVALLKKFKNKQHKVQQQNLKELNEEMKIVRTHNHKRNKSYQD